MGLKGSIVSPEDGVLQPLAPGKKAYYTSTMVIQINRFFGACYRIGINPQPYMLIAGGLRLQDQPNTLSWLLYNIHDTYTFFTNNQENPQAFVIGCI